MAGAFTSPDWGGWAVDVGRSALTWTNGYTIGFDRLLTPTDVVCWIFQLQHKGWGADALPGLIAVLDDVIDPQENQTYTAAGIRAQVAAFVANPHVKIGIPS